MRQRYTLRRDRKVWASLLASLLLHLLVFYLVDGFRTPERIPEIYRARLASVPRFRPQRWSTGAQVEPPTVAMEYLAAPRMPLEIAPSQFALPPPAFEVGLPEIPSSLPEIAGDVKHLDRHLGQGELIRPSLLGLADSVGVPSLDLLRFADRARAMKEHAVVVIDPASRQDLTGYINFARLRLPIGKVRGSLDALARYMNDYTRLLVGVQPRPYDYFLSRNLLKDPIHFLVGGDGDSGGGGGGITDLLLDGLREDEKELLGRYLRSGGFLFVEGDNRYLGAMIGLLREALDGEGQLLELGPLHPIYHSFYEFNAGFPGEDKSRLGNVEYREWGWYYPARTPDMAVARVEASAVSHFVTQEVAEVPPAEGLWGLELDGDLVAVFSDLGLSSGWARSFVDDPDDNPNAKPILPSLRAGTNIVVYALTRRRSLTVKEAPPLGMRHRHRPPVPVELETDDHAAFADAGLLTALDASLALARAPLGRELGSGLIVRLNGRYILESLRQEAHGLLLHNLPAGPHWLELEYEGQRRQFEFELEGGRVSTFTFALNRFALVRRLAIQPHDRPARFEPWREKYGDLRWEELFLAGETGREF